MQIFTVFSEIRLLVEVIYEEENIKYYKNHVVCIFTKVNI